MNEKGKIIKIEDYLNKDRVVLEGVEFDGKILDFEKFKFKKGVKEIERELFQGNYHLDDNN